MDFQIKGMEALGKAMLEIPEKIRTNVARGAMRAGAVVIRDLARDNIKSRSGELAFSVRVTSRIRNDQITVRVVAGGKVAYYAHMVERGTAPHYIVLNEKDRPARLTRRGVRSYSIGTTNKMVNRGSLKIGGRFVGPSLHHPGAVRRPFMRPAFDNGAHDALEAVREYIRNRLRTKHGLDIPAALEEGDE